MRKRDELRDPNSCLNRAGDDEMIFVLLGRDPAAQATLRAWCSERVRLKKNTECRDPQILDALACADTMQTEGALHKPVTPGPTVAEMLAERDALTQRIAHLETELRIANETVIRLRREIAPKVEIWPDGDCRRYHGFDPLREGDPK